MAVGAVLVASGLRAVGGSQCSTTSRRQEPFHLLRIMHTMTAAHSPKGCDVDQSIAETVRVLLGFLTRCDRIRWNSFNRFETPEFALLDTFLPMHISSEAPRYLCRRL